MNKPTFELSIEDVDVLGTSLEILTKVATLAMIQNPDIMTTGEVITVMRLSGLTGRLTSWVNELIAQQEN